MPVEEYERLEDEINQASIEQQERSYGESMR